MNLRSMPHVVSGNRPMSGPAGRRTRSTTVGAFSSSVEIRTSPTPSSVITVSVSRFGLRNEVAAADALLLLRRIGSQSVLTAGTELSRTFSGYPPGLESQSKRRRPSADKRTTLALSINACGASVNNRCARQRKRQLWFSRSRPHGQFEQPGGQARNVENQSLVPARLVGGEQIKNPLPSVTQKSSFTRKP